MKATRISLSVLLFVLIVSSVSACSPGQPLGPTLTPIPTSTPIPAPTSTPTPLPSPTPTLLPTATSIVFAIDTYQWEIDASLINGETDTIQVTFAPLSKEIVEKSIFPLGARASQHQINPATIYLTDSEGHKYYVEKGRPPLGGVQVQIASDTLSVTIKFPAIPPGAKGFQLHIPGHPVIDLVLATP